jgi:hypothetical protein
MSMVTIKGTRNPSSLIFMSIVKGSLFCRQASLEVPGRISSLQIATMSPIHFLLERYAISRTAHPVL